MLQLSPKLILDTDAVTRKFAFIGVSGSGKTFSAGRFVEELYHAGAQVVIVDVIGNWWGLRLDADGKRKGLPIYIFGGMRGDVPLEPTGGKLVADTIVDTGCSVVLDLSDMIASEQRRFVTDFSTQLLRRKRRAPSPIHVVWEECQDVIPEYAPGDVAHCVSAVARLTKQGRNFGVGSSFITQRPQAVAKEALNQVECLFLFSTYGAHETKALKDWLGGTVTPNALADLKTFEQGECFVWSPAWLKRFEKMRFAPKKTYDASATPKFGSAQASKQPEPLDLAKVATAMAETIERAKESDPKVLRQEIARLKAELAKRPAAVPTETKIVERSVFTEEDKQKMSFIQERISAYVSRQEEEKRTREAEIAALGERVASVSEAARDLRSMVHNALGLVEGLNRRNVFTPPTGPAEPFPRGVAILTKPEPAVTFENVKFERRPATDKAALRKGARSMLEAIASLDPRPVTREQVAMLAGLTSTSGTFSAYLSDLRRGLYISEYESGLKLTDKGWEFIGGRHHRQKAKTHDDLMLLWAPRLRAGARKMLEALAEAWPHDVDRSQLAKKVGIVESSGTFSAYLSDLRRCGVMNDAGRGKVRASNELFPS